MCRNADSYGRRRKSGSIKSASAVVVTGEEALYGNIILKKDVIEAD
ncbi:MULTISPECIES: RbsD/FucU family protein [Paenibacillus]|nr:RbsD/FucU family protein [Paenibacillus anaericanus]